MHTPRTPLATRSAASKLNIEALEERWLLSVPGILSALVHSEFSHAAIAANGLREDTGGDAYALRANENRPLLTTAEKANFLAAANAVLVDLRANENHPFFIPAEKTSFIVTANPLLVDELFAYAERRALAFAASGATLDTKTLFAKVASFLGRLDTQAREVAEGLLLRRAIESEIVAVDYVAQAHMLTDIPYEAATQPDVANLPLASEGRSEAPRDPVTPDVKSSGAGKESPANDRDLFPVISPSPSGDAAPARLKRAATIGGLSRELGLSAPVFAPLGAGLLGDIFTVDVVALEQGMQTFLNEISTLGDRLLSAPSGNRSACWFVAGVVAGAVTLEAVRWRFHRPALDRNGVSREDSAWIYRSSFSDLPVGEDA